MAAPTRVGGSFATLPNSTSLTPALPAGVQTGDALVMLVTDYNGSSPTIATPTGWTKVIDGTTLYGLNGFQRFYCFTKVAAASEPNPVLTFNSGANGFMHVLIEAWRGQDGATPFNGTAAVAAASSGAAINVPSITTTKPNSILLYLAATASSGSGGAAQITANPGSAVTRGDHYFSNVDEEIRIASLLVPSAGVVAATSFTRGVTTFTALGGVVAISGLPGGGGGASMGGYLAAVMG